MSAVLLAVHVLAAIVAIGPVCVAASMFPPEALVASTGRLAAVTGVFNLQWAVVTVLMIVRPGSSTGV